MAAEASGLSTDAIYTQVSATVPPCRTTSQTQTSEPKWQNFVQIVLKLCCSCGMKRPSSILLASCFNCSHQYCTLCQWENISDTPVLNVFDHSERHVSTSGLSEVPSNTPVAPESRLNHYKEHISDHGRLQASTSVQDSAQVELLPLNPPDHEPTHRYTEAEGREHRAQSAHLVQMSSTATPHKPQGSNKLRCDRCRAGEKKVCNASFADLVYTDRQRAVDEIINITNTLQCSHTGKVQDIQPLGDRHSHKSRIDFIWFCCDCDSGPVSHDINTCPECEHLRCSPCMFEEHFGIHERQLGPLEVQKIVQNAHLPRLEREITHIGALGENDGPRNQSSSREPVTVQPNKLRKLNTTKCDRCRTDKQKCLPTARVWPLKCDRCIAKGFSCSENQKTQRKRKYEATEPTIVPMPSSDDAQSRDYLELLQQWSSMKAYGEQFSDVLDDIRTLRYETLKCFESLVPGSPYSTSCLDRVCSLSAEQVHSSLAKAAAELSTTQPLNIVGVSAGAAITILGGQSFFHNIISSILERGPCMHCSPGPVRDILQRLEEANDVGGEFCLRKYLLYAYLNCSHNGVLYDADRDKSRLDKELSRLFALSLRIRDQVVALLERYGFKEAAVTACNMGSFYSCKISSHMFEMGRDTKDFLGQSTLHQWIEETEPCAESELAILKKNLAQFDLDSQDAQGRTALHIVCRKGSYRTAEVLLKAGANPSVVTVYGQLPLHYAVLRDLEKSSRLCELLVSNYSYDWQRLDNRGKSVWEYLLARQTQSRNPDDWKSHYLLQKWG